MPTVRTNYSRIPLATLIAIRDNQYRSKDAKRDYCPKLIDDEINIKQSRMADQIANRQIKEMEQYDRDKEELLSFIRILNAKAPKYLSESTLRIIVDELSDHVADYI